jgi:hypothetical protein
MKSLKIILKSGLFGINFGITTMLPNLAFAKMTGTTTTVPTTTTAAPKTTTTTAAPTTTTTTAAPTTSTTTTAAPTTTTTTAAPTTTTTTTTAAPTTTTTTAAPTTTTTTTTAAPTTTTTTAAPTTTTTTTTAAPTTTTTTAAPTTTTTTTAAPTTTTATTSSTTAAPYPCPGTAAWCTQTDSTYGTKNYCTQKTEYTNTRYQVNGQCVDTPENTFYYKDSSGVAKLLECAPRFGGSQIRYHNEKGECCEGTTCKASSVAFTPTSDKSCPSGLTVGTTGTCYVPSTSTTTTSTTTTATTTASTEPCTGTAAWCIQTDSYGTKNYCADPNAMPGVSEYTSTQYRVNGQCVDTPKNSFYYKDKLSGIGKILDCTPRGDSRQIRYHNDKGQCCEGSACHAAAVLFTVTSDKSCLSGLTVGTTGTCYVPSSTSTTTTATTTTAKPVTSCVYPKILVNGRCVTPV